MLTLERSQYGWRECVCGHGHHHIFVLFVPFFSVPLTLFKLLKKVCGTRCRLHTRYLFCCCARTILSCLFVVVRKHVTTTTRLCMKNRLHTLQNGWIRANFCLSDCVTESDSLRQFSLANADGSTWKKIKTHKHTYLYGSFRENFITYANKYSHLI